MKVYSWLVLLGSMDTHRIFCMGISRLPMQNFCLEELIIIKISEYVLRHLQYKLASGASQYKNIQ
jgi:hypothetical protein